LFCGNMAVFLKFEILCFFRFKELFISVPSFSKGAQRKFQE